MKERKNALPSVSSGAIRYSALRLGSPGMQCPEKIVLVEHVAKWKDFSMLQF